MPLPERLPPLTGRALTAYRVVWVIAFALALIGGTIGQNITLERNRTFNENVYRLGIRTSVIDGVRHVSPLSTSIETRGVKPDSRLLAVDGRALPSTKSFDEASLLIRALQGPEGTVHRLLLRDPGGA